jgi:hypothetical protein
LETQHILNLHERENDAQNDVEKSLGSSTPLVPSLGKNSDLENGTSLSVMNTRNKPQLSQLEEYLVLQASIFPRNLRVFSGDILAANHIRFFFINF